MLTARWLLLTLLFWAGLVFSLPARALSSPPNLLARMGAQRVIAAPRPAEAEALSAFRQTKLSSGSKSSASFPGSGVSGDAVVSAKWTWHPVFFSNGVAADLPFVCCFDTDKIAASPRAPPSS